MRPGLVVIGGSLGGYEAVTRILRSLAPDPGPPIAIVLHRAAGTRVAIADHLSRATRCRVFEVMDGQQAVPGHVYLAPADYHLLIDRNHLSLSLDPPESHARPSIDVLFASAAEVYRERAVGVLLTAASEDGVRGLLAIRAAGGLAVVQSPETAESPIAPRAAITRGASDQVVPLDQIGPTLRRLVR